jgi:hypothetical protein
MAKWMVQAARRCAGLIDLLRAEICSGQLINVDESPLQVLNEAGRKKYQQIIHMGLSRRPVVEIN